MKPFFSRKSQSHIKKITLIEGDESKNKDCQNAEVLLSYSQIDEKF